MVRKREKIWDKMCTISTDVKVGSTADIFSKTKKNNLSLCFGEAILTTDCDMVKLVCWSKYMNRWFVSKKKKRVKFLLDAKCHGLNRSLNSLSHEKCNNDNETVNIVKERKKCPFFF